MGGSSEPQQAQPTPEEIQRIKIAQEQWDFYKRVGKPVEQEYIRSATGMESDGKGGFNIVKNGVLNQDGSVHTNTAMAVAANERAFNPKMQGVDPNSGFYRGGLNNLQAAKMRSGAETQAGMQLNQQNRWVKGLENTIALGRNQNTQAVAGLSDLANQSAAKAINDSNKAFQDESANRYLVGQVAGMGTSMYLNKPSAQSKLGLASLSS